VNTTWRCFVAVPLPASLRSRLAEVVTAWRAEPAAPDVRWTAPDGWHLTLAFLGDVDPAAVSTLIGGLRATLQETPGWQVQTGGLGAFPGPGRARVLWYGIADADGRLATLAEAARSSLAPIVPTIRDGSPFRAHITLGRTRQARGLDLLAWLAGHAAPVGSLPVQRAVLYRSVQGGGQPARYEALGAVALAPARGAIMDAEAEAPMDG
jgi:RNA 2',3'-cyclic 3'-phosphodiesterase